MTCAFPRHCRRPRSLLLLQWASEEILQAGLSQQASLVAGGFEFFSSGIPPRRDAYRSIPFVSEPRGLL